MCAAYTRLCRRVVLAREMTGGAIAAVTAACRAETEVFLHGALCVCHSGQCLFSSLVGGRSGNRGECAQPCRLPYNGGYPLSLQDLCLSGHIPELIDSGVASLKIEGRMKSPDYVFRVCSVYRRLLDEGRIATPEERKVLAAAFSRGGFTDGYYTGEHRRPMCGVRSEADKEKTRLSGKEEAYQPKKKKLTAEAVFLPGEAARLTLCDGEKRACAVGDTVPPARTAPVGKEFVTTQLCKMGGTFYALAPEDIALTLGDGCFLTAGELNALRRAAVEKLREKNRPPLERREKKDPGEAAAAENTAENTAKSATENIAENTAENTAEKSGVTGLPVFQVPVLPRRELPRRQAVCYTAGQVRAVRASGWFDLCIRPLYLRGAPLADGVMLPPVVMPGEEEAFCNAMRQAADSGVRYALCEAAWQFAAARDAGLVPLADFRLNITNAKSFLLLLEQGVEDIVLSPEVPVRALAGLPGRVLTYGRIPLMVTERCFMREAAGGCDGCGKIALRDRKNARFPIVRIPLHRNEILNSLPTYMGDRREELDAAGVAAEQYRFTVESAEETAAVIAAARKQKELKGPVRRLFR